jgi:hypothetical protein
MTPAGAPSVAFRWMEVEGPLYDADTAAGYRLLFGDLPLRKTRDPAAGLALPSTARGDRREGGRQAGQRVEPLEETRVEIVSADPHGDAARLLRGFLDRAYRRPVAEADRQRFLALFDERRGAGLGFAEAMVATTPPCSPRPDFVFLDEKPGRLDDPALATRLALFLWNSPPDAALRARAARGELSRPEVLREETERLLADPRAQRFREAFLDYWIDLRKMEDSTPSTTLYNDYYLDDALAEAAVAETRLTFDEMVRADRPVARGRRRGFHLPQRAPRHPLRHPRREGRRDAPRHAAAGQPARRFHDAGQRPQDHRQRHHHLTSAARQVDRRAHPRRRHPAAAAGRRRGARHPGCRDDPPAAREAPQRPQLRGAATAGWIHPGLRWRIST